MPAVRSVGRFTKGAAKAGTEELADMVGNKSIRDFRRKKGINRPWRQNQEEDNMNEAYIRLIHILKEGKTTGKDPTETGKRLGRALAAGKIKGRRMPRKDQKGNVKKDEEGNVKTWNVRPRRRLAQVIHKIGARASEKKAAETGEPRLSGGPAAAKVDARHATYKGVEAGAKETKRGRKGHRRVMKKFQKEFPAALKQAIASSDLRQND